MTPEQLARHLASADGLAAVLALQAQGIFGAAAAPPRQSLMPLLDWLPRVDGDVVVYERPAAVRCKPRVLRPPAAGAGAMDGSSPAGPLRVAVFGESMAAGFPHAPAYGPAHALEASLGAAMRPRGRAVDVIDFAAPNMGPSEQLRVAETAIAVTRPHVCVFLGGNNWHYGLAVEPVAPPAARASWARVVTEGGTAALAARFRALLVARARVMVQTLVAAARSHGAVAIVVVPASNHAWERRSPTPWLGAGRTARWHATFADAERALARGDDDGAAAALEAAAALARIEGDVAQTGMPARVAARAHERAGRLDVAAACADEAIAASNWHNVGWALPQVPRFVADAMRAEARALASPCIDLADVFARHTGSPWLDFRMFVDHCHLSVEATAVTARVVADVVADVVAEAAGDRVADRGVNDVAPAAAVVPAGSAVAAVSGVSASAPLPAVVAGGWLQAAHWSSLLAPFVDDAAAVDAVVVLLRRALQAEPAALSTLADALRIKELWRSPTLHPVLARAGAMPGAGRVFSSPRLNTVWCAALARVLAERDVAMADSVGGAVLAAHDRALAAGIDLADPARADRFWERTPLGAHDPHERQATPFFRAAWPVSCWSFLVGEPASVELELVARTQLRGDVMLRVNDVGVASSKAPPTWCRWRVFVPAASLVVGRNRVEVCWPALDVDDDARLDAAVQRLRRGADGDLFPVFGEVWSLRVVRIANAEATAAQAGADRSGEAP
jgi:hypothetical protein